MAEMSSSKSTIGFIGAGNMASALLGGMAQSEQAPSKLIAFDLDEKKTQALSEKWGVEPAKDLSDLISRSDIIFLAVKPGVIPRVAQACASSSHKLIVSIAAGVSIATIEQALGDNPSARGLSVIRLMPNTPALVGEGACALCTGEGVSDEDRRLVESLLRSTTRVVTVTEAQMDAVTGVSGSGPAYIMLIIEAMADGGVREGLSREVALELAAQTVLGSAKLVLETGQHPGALKDAVTSPAGTTIAAVAALENAGIRAAMISAVHAAAQRSRALSSS